MSSLACGNRIPAGDHHTLDFIPDKGLQKRIPVPRMKRIPELKSCWITGRDGERAGLRIHYRWLIRREKTRSVRRMPRSLFVSQTAPFSHPAYSRINSPPQEQSQGRRYKSCTGVSPSAMCLTNRFRPSGRVSATRRSEILSINTPCSLRAMPEILFHS